MNLYKDFYENFVPGDSGFSNVPQLILFVKMRNIWQNVLKKL